VRALGLSLLVLAFGAWAPVARGAPPQTVDSAGFVGFSSSVELAATGHPVISYYETIPPFPPGDGDLKVVHCNDTACAGGDEVPHVADGAGNVGLNTSLELDAAGNPVISYYDLTNEDVKLLHCNDPACAGGDETPHTVDGPGRLGEFQTSLQLSAVGNPVVSYYDTTNGNLKVVHCNDPACAGGDESPQIVDGPGDVGLYSSLRLDAAGNPAISYFDRGNADLKYVRCNDPVCGGGDESPQVVESAGNVGTDTSLDLDTAGHPVISYIDITSSQVKVVRCNDTACAGGDESPQALDLAADPGSRTSLELDALDRPVVSYFYPLGELRLVHCNDPACAGGDESPQTADGSPNAGDQPSLALDALGNPVISYLDISNIHLRLVHCDTADCGGTARVPGHFLLYRLDQPEATGETVTVVDRFATRSVRLQEAEWLLVPAGKERAGRPAEPIQRPDEHLVCYGLPYTASADRPFAVRNQFAASTLRLGRPLTLCAPASKSVGGVPGAPPADLDHHVCYDVRGETPSFASETLHVRDQFGARTVRIDRARELCVPAEKRRTGHAPEPVRRPDELYACYRITTQTPAFAPLSVAARDQFGLRTLSVAGLERLCAPTTAAP
jgi:hypothetical protein